MRGCINDDTHEDLDPNPNDPVSSFVKDPQQSPPTGATPPEHPTRAFYEGPAVPPPEPPARAPGALMGRSVGCSDGDFRSCARNIRKGSFFKNKTFLGRTNPLSALKGRLGALMVNFRSCAVNTEKRNLYQERAVSGPKPTGCFDGTPGWGTLMGNLRSCAVDWKRPLLWAVFGPTPPECFDGTL